MRSFILIFFTALLFGCLFSDGNSEDVINKLKKEGIPYFRHLIMNQQYDLLLDKIEGGDVVLITNAFMLSRWADASTSLSLKYALSRAITKKPDEVLSLIPKYFSITDVCRVPYAEETIEIELSHVVRSLAALSQSKKAKTNNIYRQCINIYKAIKNNITKDQIGLRNSSLFLQKTAKLKIK